VFLVVGSSFNAGVYGYLVSRFSAEFAGDCRKKPRKNIMERLHDFTLRLPYRGEKDMIGIIKIYVKLTEQTYTHLK
jgi:hypothetical protein